MRERIRDLLVRLCMLAALVKARTARDALTGVVDVYDRAES